MRTHKPSVSCSTGKVPVPESICQVKVSRCIISATVDPDTHPLDPVPIFDITINLQNRHLQLPLESAFTRSCKLLNRPWLLFVCGAAYIISLAFFSRSQSFLTPASSYLSCLSTFWIPNNQCDLDGHLCSPFSNSSFDFRCPAQCDSVILQNPRTIGNEQVAFQPLIVGGGDELQTYRGDSFICAAAIQACVPRLVLFLLLNFIPSEG